MAYYPKRVGNKTKKRYSKIRKTYRKKIIRKTKMSNTRYRYMKGGHRNERLPHYHLLIQLPNGGLTEMHETFERSGDGEDGRETSGKVQDIMDFVADNRSIGTRPFTLTWRQSKMVNPNVRIRDIRVDGARIPISRMYRDDAIIVTFNDEVPPEIFTDVDVAREAFDEDGNLRESF